MSEETSKCFRELHFKNAETRKSKGRNGDFVTASLGTELNHKEGTVYFFNRSMNGSVTNGWVVLPNDPELVSELIEQLKMIKNEIQIEQLLS